MAKNTWVANFGNSVKFGMIEAAKGLTPGITNVIESNREYLTNILDTVRELKTGQTKINTAIDKTSPELAKTINAIMAAGNTGGNNLKRFLSTGDVQGPNQTSAQDVEASIGSTEDLNLDNFDDVDKDLFNFDDLPSPEEAMADGKNSTDEAVVAGAKAQVAASQASMQAQVAGAKVVAANVSRVGNAVNTQTQIMAKGFEGQSRAVMKTSMQNLAFQEKIAHTTHTQLQMVNDNLANMIAFNNDTHLKHAMAAMKYYESSLAELQTISQTLKRAYPEKENQKLNESDYESVFGLGGQFDLSSYMKVVQGNLKNTPLGPLVGILEQPEMITEYIANIDKYIMKWGAEALIPNVVKAATKELDKTFTTFLPALFGKLAGYENDPTANPILQAIGSIFGIKAPSTRLDLGDYEKGAVPFDGITHRTINQVIPTYLSKILSALTGGEEHYYNHEFGQFETMSDIRARQKSQERNTRNMALGDLGTELTDSSKYLTFANDNEKRIFTEAIENFKEAMVNSGQFVNWNDTDQLREIMQNVSVAGMNQSQSEAIADWIGEIARNSKKSNQIEASMAAYEYANRMRTNLHNAKQNGDLGYWIANSGFTDIDSARQANEANARWQGNGYNTGDIVGNVQNMAYYGRGRSSLNPRNWFREPPPRYIEQRYGTSTNAPRFVAGYARDVEEAQNRYNELIEQGDGITNPEYDKLEAEGHATFETVMTSGAKRAFELQKEYLREKKKEADELEHKDLHLSGEYDPYMDDDYFADDEETKRRRKAKLSTKDSLKQTLYTDPANFIAQGIQSVNEIMYRVLFGTNEDEGSVLEVLVDNISSLFNNVKNWLVNDIFKPVKEYFFGEDWKQTKFYKSMTGLFDNIANSFKGTKDADGLYHDGIGSEMINEFTDIGKEMRNVVTGKEYTDSQGNTHPKNENSVFGEMRAALRSLWSTFKKYLFGSKDEEEEQKATEAWQTEFMNSVNGGRAATGGFVPRSGSYILSKGEKVIQGHYALGTKLIGETGLYDLSRGDVVVPGGKGRPSDIERAQASEANFTFKVLGKTYGGIKSGLSSVESAVQNVSRTIVAQFQGDKATPGLTKEIRKLNQNLMEGNGNSAQARADARIDRITELVQGLVQGDENAPRKKPMIDAIFDKVANSVAQFAGALGGSSHFDNKYINKEYMAAIRKKAPKAVARGMVGGGMLAIPTMLGGGILGNLIGGPLGAIAIGMGVSLLHHNDSFLDMMYGKKDENGERTGGVIPKKVQDAIKKNKTGIIGGAMLGTLNAIGIGPGALISSMLGIGPIGGVALGAFAPIIIGSAVGFAVKSESFQRLLFGTGNPEDGEKAVGILNGKNAKAMKKVLPNFIVGAGLGAIGAGMAGSVGLLGAVGISPYMGAILGGAAGIGLASDKFRDALFGKYDEKQKRFVSGGLVDTMKNAIKGEILTPVSVFAQKSFAKLQHFLATDIMYPIAKAFYPMKAFVETLMTNIGNNIRDILTGTGKRIYRLFDFILAPLRKLAVTAWDVTWGMTKNMINAASSITGTIMSLPLKALSAGASILGRFAGPEYQEAIEAGKQKAKDFKAEADIKYKDRMEELKGLEKDYKYERKEGRKRGWADTEAQLQEKTDRYHAELERIAEEERKAAEEAAARRATAEAQREELKTLLKEANLKLDAINPNTGAFRLVKSKTNEVAFNTYDKIEVKETQPNVSDLLRSNNVVRYSETQSVPNKIVEGDNARPAGTAQLPVRMHSSSINRLEEPADQMMGKLVENSSSEVDVLRWIAQMLESKFGMVIDANVQEVAQEEANHETGFDALKSGAFRQGGMFAFTQLLKLFHISGFDEDVKNWGKKKLRGGIDSVISRRSSDSSINSLEALAGSQRDSGSTGFGAWAVRLDDLLKESSETGQDTNHILTENMTKTEQLLNEQKAAIQQIGDDIVHAIQSSSLGGGHGGALIPYTYGGGVGTSLIQKAKDLKASFGSRTADNIVKDRAEKSYKDSVLEKLDAIKSFGGAAVQKTSEGFDWLKSKIPFLLGGLGLAIAAGTYAIKKGWDLLSEKIENGKKFITDKFNQYGIDFSEDGLGDIASKLYWGIRGDIAESYGLDRKANIGTLMGTIGNDLADKVKDAIFGDDAQGGLVDNIATAVKAKVFGEDNKDKGFAENIGNSISNSIKDRIFGKEDENGVAESTYHAERFQNDLLKAGGYFSATEAYQKGAKAVKAAPGIVKNIATAPGRIAMEAIDVVDKYAPKAVDKGLDLAAKAESKSVDLVNKVVDLAEKAIDKIKNVGGTIADILGKHLPKFCDFLSGILGKLKSLASNGKKLAQIAGHLSLKIGKAAGKTAAAGVSLGTSIAVFGVIDATWGALDAAEIFQVDPDKVDGNMRKVAAVFNAIMGLPGVVFLDMAFEVIALFSDGEANIRSNIASFLYQLIADEDWANLDALQAQSKKGYEEWKSQEGNEDKSYDDYQTYKNENYHPVLDALSQIPGVGAIRDTFKDAHPIDSIQSAWDSFMGNTVDENGNPVSDESQGGIISKIQTGIGNIGNTIDSSLDNVKQTFSNWWEGFWGAEGWEESDDASKRPLILRVAGYLDSHIFGNDSESDNYNPMEPTVPVEESMVYRLFRFLQETYQDIAEGASKINDKIGEGLRTVGRTVENEVIWVGETIAAMPEEIREWVTGGEESGKYGGKNFFIRGLSSISDGFEVIGKSANAGILRLKEVIGGAITFMNDATDTAVKTVEDWWNTSPTIGERIVQSFNDGVEWITGGEKDGPYEGKFILRRMLEGALGIVNDALKTAIPKISDAVEGFIKGVVDFFSAAKTLAGGAIDVIKGAISSPLKFASSIIGSLVSMGSSAKDRAGEAFEKAMKDAQANKTGGKGYALIPGGYGGMGLKQNIGPWANKDIRPGHPEAGKMDKAGCGIITSINSMKASGIPVSVKDGMNAVSASNLAKDGSGLTGKYMKDVASKSGAKFNEIDTTQASMESALKSGKNLVAGVQTGMGGHYLNLHGFVNRGGQGYAIADDPAGGTALLSTKAATGLLNAPRSPRTLGYMSKGKRGGKGGFLFGGMGNKLFMPQQSSGSNCTLTATAALINAYKGTDYTSGDFDYGGSDWWYSNLLELPATENIFSPSEGAEFTNYLESKFSANPEHPMLLYQVGGDGSSGDHPLNRGGGAHATVIGRKLADGTYEIYDSNGGMIHKLNANQIFDPTASGSDQGYDSGEGNIIFDPQIEPSDKITEWKASSGSILDEVGSAISSGIDTAKSTASNIGSAISSAIDIFGGFASKLSEIIGIFVKELFGDAFGSLFGTAEAATPGNRPSIDLSNIGPAPGKGRENIPNDAIPHYVDVAERASMLSGIPTDWIYAQWANEAGRDFDSPLATHNHNLAGVTVTDDMPGEDGDMRWGIWNSDEDFADYWGGTFIKLWEGSTTAKTMKEYVHNLQNQSNGEMYCADPPEEEKYYANMASILGNHGTVISGGAGPALIPLSGKYQYGGGFAPLAVGAVAVEQIALQMFRSIVARSLGEEAIGLATTFFYRYIAPSIPEFGINFHQPGFGSWLYDILTDWFGEFVSWYEAGGGGGSLIPKSYGGTGFGGLVSMMDNGGMLGESFFDSFPLDDATESINKLKFSHIPQINSTGFKDGINIGSLINAVKSISIKSEAKEMLAYLKIIAEKSGKALGAEYYNGGGSGTGMAAFNFPNSSDSSFGSMSSSKESSPADREAMNKLTNPGGKSSFGAKSTNALAIASGGKLKYS